MEYIFYTGLGAIAGLISGLFGVGGGAVIVPMLIFAFAAQGIVAEVATHLAIGTSLATICFTSLSSIYTHHQKGAIRWDLVKTMTPAILFGSWLGGIFAISLQGGSLQILFGGFMVAVALQLLLYTPAVGARSLPGVIGTTIAGSIIGGISALFGIGGGTLSTPFLSFYGVKIHQAVGTAAAIGFPIALAATYVYMIADVGGLITPEGSFGYVFAPAWLGIVVASIPFARLGAKIAHRANEKVLRIAFGCMMLLLGSRFIWINLAT